MEFPYFLELSFFPYYLLVIKFSLVFEDQLFNLDSSLTDFRSCHKFWALKKNILFSTVHWRYRIGKLCYCLLMLFELYSWLYSNRNYSAHWKIVVICRIELRGNKWIVTDLYIIQYILNFGEKSVEQNSELAISWYINFELMILEFFPWFYTWLLCDLFFFLFFFLFFRLTYWEEIILCAVPTVYITNREIKQTCSRYNKYYIMKWTVTFCFIYI